MPIEDIKVPVAPRGWAPNADQAARIRADPRLQRMDRNGQFAYFNQPQNQPARGPASAGDRARQAGRNAMSWHPAVMFQHVSDKIKQALGH